MNLALPALDSDISVELSVIVDTKPPGSSSTDDASRREEFQQEAKLQTELEARILTDDSGLRCLSATVCDDLFFAVS